MRQIDWFLAGLLTLFGAYSVTGSAAPAGEGEMSPFEQSRLYREQAAKSYGEGNLAGAYDGFQKALELVPNHPGLMSNLAVIAAQRGEADKSLDWLEHYADLGLVADLTQFEEMKVLADHPRLAEIKAHLNANGEPAGDVTKVLVLADKIRIGEGLVYDERADRYLISSVGERAIYSIDRTGGMQPFLDGAGLAIAGITGMKIAPEAGILWFAGAGLPPVPGLAAEERNRSAVYATDLDGKIIKRLDMPGQGHLFGDLILSKDGGIYVSDSGDAPAIYRLSAKTGQYERIAGGPAFGSLQGLAFSGDEQTLYFADYSTGLYALDRTTREVAALRPSEKTTLLGIDGLYFYKNSLIAIQNGVTPNRVIRLRLDNAGRRIERVETLAANHPDIADPTLGFIRKDDFLFIANSQWPKFGRGTPAPDELDRIVILKVPLTP